MRRIALAVLILTGVTHAQANRSAAPTTATPAAGPVEKADETARPHLTRGLGLLESGDNQGAMLAFSDGLFAYGTPASTAAGDSMVHAALNHASAIANLRLEKFPPAKQGIDRAINSKWTNESLLYNAAIIATAIRGSAVTAVNMLDKYLVAHPDADESWVNLYGLALEKASPDAAARQRLEPKFKTLADYQTRLEATQPGKHRWGSEWIDEEQWKALKAQKDEADKKNAQLQAAVDDAQQDLQRAQQRATQSTGRRGRGGGGGGGGGGNATAAREKLAEAQKALAEADRGPQPTWDVPLTGRQPDPQMTLK